MFHRTVDDLDVIAELGGICRDLFDVFAGLCYFFQCDLDQL